MSEHPTFSAGQLLRALVEGEVRFVVIGGLAAQAHGSPLITGRPKDLLAIEHLGALPEQIDRRG